MGAVLLDRPKRRMICASGCQTVQLAHDDVDAPIGGGAAVLHVCAALGGIVAPLVDERLDCKISTVERGDYIGDEIVQLDTDGRPIMAVVTTRNDGEDRVVLAPQARRIGDDE